MRFDGKTGSGIPSASNAVKPTIHIFHILDTSSSMGRYDYGTWGESKYKNAVDGFELEVKELEKDKTVDYTFSLLTFDKPGQGIRWRTLAVNKIPDQVLTDLKNYNTVGWTALNDAIAEGVKKALTFSENGDKVILTILTDGGENASSVYSSYYSGAAKIKRIVEDAKSKITINFVGTDYDTEVAINTYGITRSNTMKYDGTSEGLKMSSLARTQSTLNYSKKLSSGASGQSLTADFFFEQ